MGLTLLRMTDLNKKLAAGLPLVAPVLTSQSETTEKGFLEKKQEEEKRRLEAEIEIKEREKYLKKLQSDIDELEGKSGKAKTYVVNPEAEQPLQEVKPGEPIVIKAEEKVPPKSYIINPNAEKPEEALSEISSDRPAVILISKQQEQPKTKSYIINPNAEKPDETLLEVTDKHAVFLISKSASQNAPQATKSWAEQTLDFLKEISKLSEVRETLLKLLGISARPEGRNSEVILQMTDAEGNPIKLDLPTYKDLVTFQLDLAHKKERHEETVALIREAREAIPRIVGAIDRYIKRKTAEIVEVKCDKCGYRTTVMKGVKQFYCPECDTTYELAW